MADESAVPARVVLDGARRVNHQDGVKRCPEDIPFPSVMRACLDFLGEDAGAAPIQAHGAEWRLDHTYTFFMGVTGEAFRFEWLPKEGENPTVGPEFSSVDPVLPFRRALEAAGYGVEILLRPLPGSTVPPDPRFDECSFRAAVV
jgi:hypothetical protein